MARLRFVPALLLVSLVCLPASAGVQTRVIKPLSGKDLTSFKQEGAGGWKIDNKTDLVYTLIVCPKATGKTSLLFISKRFTDGFQVRCEVKGGYRNRGIDVMVVPPKGDRIVVPFAHRELTKKEWHDFKLTVRNGSAHVEVDGKAGKDVSVPKGQPLTFAFHLDRFSEAMIRKLEVLYLVVSKVQKKPDKGFIRIFDGKSIDGWRNNPAGSTAFKAGDQEIDGKLNAPGKQVELIFTQAVFKDLDLKFRASGDSRNLYVIGRFGIKGQCPATYAIVTNYAAGGRDWNEYEWIVTGKDVNLKVNGNAVWHATAGTDAPVQVTFILVDQGGGALARIRDVQVKGKVVRMSKKFADMAKASGVNLGGAPSEGNPGSGSPGSQQGPAVDNGRRVLFDGKSLADWNARPSGVWSVVDGKMMGATLDMKTGGQIIYAKLIFKEYHLSFSVQKGTAGASFLAKAVPAKFGKKAPVVVKLDGSWFTKEWNQVDAVCVGTTLKIRVNGEDKKAVDVPTEPGFIGFTLKKNAAIGVKDVVFTNPE